MATIFCCTLCLLVLQERLADAQNAQTAADAEAKAADIKTKHLAKQAAEQRKGLASKDKEASGMRKQLDDAQRKVDACTQKLQGLSYDAAAVEQLEATRQREVAEMRSAKEAVEVLGAQLSTLEFHYRCVDAIRGVIRGHRWRSVGCHGTNAVRRLKGGACNGHRAELRQVTVPGRLRSV